MLMKELNIKLQSFFSLFTLSNSISKHKKAPVLFDVSSSYTILNPDDTHRKYFGLNANTQLSCCRIPFEKF